MSILEVGFDLIILVNDRIILASAVQLLLCTSTDLGLRIHDVIDDSVAECLS